MKKSSKVKSTSKKRVSFGGVETVEIAAEPEKVSSEEEDDVEDEKSSSEVVEGTDFAAAFGEIMSERVKEEPLLSRGGGFAREIKKRKLEDAIAKKVTESRKAL